MQQSIETPWWNVLEFRDEIHDAAGAVRDIQTSLYRVAYDRSPSRPLYAEPEYYGQITHPTAQLTALLARIAIALGGPPHAVEKRVIRLTQSMGGGKSHACVGAYHLATSPAKFAGTDLGQSVRQAIQDKLGFSLPSDLDNPHVVVLSCDNMTPGVTSPDEDGPVARSLHQRFLYRLFQGDSAKYDAYESSFGSKVEIARAIGEVGRPVLIIIDELLNYVGQGLDGASLEQVGLAGQDMSFLRALFEAVGDVSGAALLVVMISSEQDATALSPVAEDRRAQIEADLTRNGSPWQVTDAADFAAILRRRLFACDADPAAIAAAASALSPTHAGEPWSSKVFDQLSASWVKDFAGQVERCYPFHPQLMAMAEAEWAKLAGFQRVRSTIKIFAAAAYALQQRARSTDDVPLLIGLGDLPLSDIGTRHAVLDSGLISDAKIQANYGSMTLDDIVSADGSAGAARLLDMSRELTPWTAANPRAAERAATAIFLSSIVGLRGHGRQGAADVEVLAALYVSDSAFGFPEAEGVLRRLTDERDGMTTLEVLPGKGGQPPRYVMKTGLRLHALVRAMRNTVTDEERDTQIADRISVLIKSVPFDNALLVRAQQGKAHRSLLADFIAEGDSARSTRLVALDPSMFAMQNGEEAATRQAVESALGLGLEPIASKWAASVVFVAASTRSRAQMRTFASDYLAYRKAAETISHNRDEATDGIGAKAADERDRARQSLDRAIRRGFQHLMFLGHTGTGKVYRSEQLQGNVNDGDGRTALDGNDVWRVLVDADRAAPPGGLDGKALQHNLRNQDYGCPITELRDSFWNNPRLPLLAGGEAEIRRALQDAQDRGFIRLAWGSGQDAISTSAADIAINNEALRVLRPLPKTETTQPAESSRPQHTTLPSMSTALTGSSHATASVVRPARRIGLTLTEDLSQHTDRAADLGAFLREVWVALDSGQVSQIAAQIQLVLSGEAADAIVAYGERLGLNVVDRELGG